MKTTVQFESLMPLYIYWHSPCIGTGMLRRANSEAWGELNNKVMFPYLAMTKYSRNEQIQTAPCSEMWCVARDKLWKVLVCGGGRKNTTLIEKIKSRTLKNLVIQPIDDYDIDGDYVESQAFAYLAIRSYLGLPISFPKTTGCKEPAIGGVLVKNY